MTPGFENRTRQLILNGDLALGLIVRIVRTPEIALIARQSGHDFIFVDTQHAAFDLAAIAGLAIAATALGVTPLVRVRGHDDPDIAVLLDAGVAGLIVPDVATADQARAVVCACRYPPHGARSYAGPAIGLGYGAMAPGPASKVLNDQTLVICMIETREGLANAAEIAAVEGVDVLHIGCGDLLMDMGLPGQFDGPEIAAAVRQVIACSRAAGKVTGFGGDRDRVRQRRYIDEGVRFVTTQADVALLLAAAAASAADLRR